MAFKMKKPSMTQGTAAHKSALKQGYEPGGYKPPKNKSQKAEYKRFTEYGVRLLEQASPERLEKMLAIFEKEKAKKKKAGGTHYYQDYNIAYINILLNK